MEQRDDKFYVTSKPIDAPVTKVDDFVLPHDGDLTPIVGLPDNGFLSLWESVTSGAPMPLRILPMLSYMSESEWRYHDTKSKRAVWNAAEDTVDELIISDVQLIRSNYYGSSVLVAFFGKHDGPGESAYSADPFVGTTYGMHDYKTPILEARRIAGLQTENQRSTVPGCEYIPHMVLTDGLALSRKNRTFLNSLKNSLHNQHVNFSRSSDVSIGVRLQTIYTDTAETSQGARY